MAVAEGPPDQPGATPRLLTIVVVAIGIGVAAGIVAKALLALIALITGVLFYGQVTSELLPPSPDRIGAWLIAVPVVGAVVIGLMARYGATGIRGHGIPEVMERVLYGESRIAPRLMFLKPASAAIAIGTGGPFGAEGPIIATGGALGSLVGQVLHVTAEERKTLLAAGAAGGMAATFGTPVSAVLLSIELLLFEYRPRSIIPVALAASAATAVRLLLIGTGPVFAMAPLTEPSWTALTAYVVIGALVGLASVGVTRTIYAIEDGFERLPIHWMWWPALGALVVGLVGWLDPRILGVGYEHIDGILTGELVGTTLAGLILLKFVAWSVYLGSGTSGGTLAPLFIIGGGLGSLLGLVGSSAAPGLDISPTVAGLVGMAAMFAGASHALLASIVFAFEATRQPLSLLPLLAGGTAAYLVSILLMRTSIMTERLARRGAVVQPEYALDFFQQVTVEQVMTTSVVALAAARSLADVRSWLLDDADGATHQGFPVVSGNRVIGVLTRRDLLGATIEPHMPVRELVKREPVVAFPKSTLRQAADQMVRARVGRLPVVDPDGGTLLGIVSRSDLIAAHEQRLAASSVRGRGIGRS